MREWLRRTHGPIIELLRHFVQRFFDSDTISTPGQMAGPLIGVFSLMLPWFNMMIGMLREKYAHFNGLATPGPYRHIVRADELWLVTLMMSVIGLITAVKWESVFPTLRDYRTLGTLPLRAWKIFAAKLAALLLVATAAVVTLNLVPSAGFPAVSASRWQYSPGAAVPFLAYVVSCVSGSYFYLLGLVALQGLLLNALRPRAFGRVAGYIQGIAVAAMLVQIVLSFSIDARIADLLVQSPWANWLPPVWFLGVYQTILRDPSPAMHALAQRAWLAFGIAVLVALLTYALSYHRHRELLVEGLSTPARDRRWSAALLRFLIRDPRQQAVAVFIGKTLARSSHHRMILMGYGGFAFAILMSGIAEVRTSVSPALRTAAGFTYCHVVVMAFLLIALRHLFSIPTELPANWMFRLTEREGRADWLRAVDRVVLTNGAIAIVLVPFPLEWALLGWHSLLEAALFAGLALMCYEWTFSSWDKLPFTCSHLPGKTAPWIRFLQFLGLLGAMPLASFLIVAGVYYPAVFLIVMTVQLAVWNRIHSSRQEGWGEVRLKFDEAPEQVIHGLNLLG